jgi:sulfur transfer protein SufE
MMPPTDSAQHRRANWIRALEQIHDPQSRLGWILDQARSIAPLPIHLRTEPHLFPGCRVRLWWIPSFHNGQCEFHTDSDSVTLKALTHLIAQICGKSTPSEIAELDFSFLETLGVLRQLAESRQATLRRIIEATHEFTSLHRAKNL